jgi:hypothetical protein
MDKLSSSFIVLLDSNFLEEDSTFIVVEYCPNNDVSGSIKKCKVTLYFQGFTLRNLTT